jgi:hypothetical protein
MVTVGQGRGFVVDGRYGRLVITAGACVPEAVSNGEVTYPDLLGSSQGARRVPARCVFFDSVSGVAVFDCPPYEDSSAAQSEYRSLMDTTTALSIANFVG